MAGRQRATYDLLFPGRFACREAEWDAKAAIGDREFDAVRNLVVNKSYSYVYKC